MLNLARILKQETDVPEGEPGVIIKNQCYFCEHQFKDNPTKCKAFPKGIPVVILLDQWDHHFGFETEELSDNGILFSRDLTKF